VYACVVDRLEPGGARALAKAVINVGERPTVGAGFGVEAHLFDFDGDLYGRELRLHLCARLREERRFAGLDELRAQIGRDMSDAKGALGARTPTGTSWY
jgi:riboflavin kinase/FMN adenylyltransferase